MRANIPSWAGTRLYPQRPPLTKIPPRVEPSVAAPRVEPPAPTPPTQAPRLEPPRRSARLGGASKPDQPSAPDHRTWSKNPNSCSVAKEAMISCSDVSELKLSPKTLATRRFPI